MTKWNTDVSHLIVVVFMMLLCVLAYYIGYGRGYNVAWYQSQDALEERIENQISICITNPRDNEEFKFGGKVFVVNKTDKGILWTIKDNGNNR
jgi:hypothetical protein